MTVFLCEVRLSVTLVEFSVFVFSSIKLDCDFIIKLEILFLIVGFGLEQDEKD